MTVLTDTFTNSDGTTLVNHTATGVEGGYAWVNLTGGAGFTIDSNRLRNGSSGQFTAVRADRGLDSNDQEVEIEVVSASEGSSRFTIGLIARKDSSATLTYYSLSLAFENGTDTMRLFKKVNNVDTDLDTQTVTWANGDVLRLTVEGTSLKGYQNETERFSGTDSSITSGDYVGLTRAANSSAPFMLLDNFAADVVTSGGGGGGEGAPMEVVQVHEETESDSSITFNFPTTPTAGNRVVLVVTSGSNATFTASGFTTDLNSGTGIGSRCSIFSKLQTTGNSFTVNRSAGTGDWRVVGYEIPPCEFDVGDTTEGEGPDDTLGSLSLGPTATTTFANAIAISGVRFSGNSSGRTVNSSFTEPFDDNPRQSAAHKILSSTQTVSLLWDWTNGIDHAGGCLAVYGSEGGGAGGAPVRAARWRACGPAPIS
jgi:hypothetical protein